MHEACQAKKPSRRVKIGASSDAIGHEKLGKVDEKSGSVTDKKNDHNANENSGQIHLIVDAAVLPMRAAMRKP